MSRTSNTPLPISPPPELAAPELAPLLSEPFASAYAQAAPGADRLATLRGRLGERVAASLAAEAPLVTRRRGPGAAKPLAPGVQVLNLYQAESGAALRPGEPLRVRLLEMAPGATLPAALLDPEALLQPRHREWLLVAGQAQADGEALSLRDYLVTPAGWATPAWQAGPEGAMLFLRESALAAAPGDRAHAVLDAEAGWPDFAPGVQRRVLWQRDGQAALLYLAQAGATVPYHQHGHDEECLMVQGELFLDDLLLQAGDWQLAPAGTGHHATFTDTGAVIYAHGDLDLRFV